MRWRKLIEDFFKENKEGTTTDIKNWIRDNKFDLIKEDKIKWVERICSEDPKLKLIWYDCKRDFKKTIYELTMRHIKECNAQLRFNLNNMISKGLLKEEENFLGFNKIKYVRN